MIKDCINTVMAMYLSCAILTCQIASVILQATISWQHTHNKSFPGQPAHSQSYGKSYLAVVISVPISPILTV